MMRGVLSYDKWSFMDLGGGRHFVAERIVNGQTEQKNISAHCLACAKAEIIAKYGGQVDCRGWHRQGICGVFLVAMIQGNAGEPV